MRKVKKIMVFFLVFMVTIVTFIVFSGEYFFNYAIVRKQEEDKIIRDVPSWLSCDKKKIIQNNQKLEGKITSDWFNNVKSSMVSKRSRDGLVLKAREFYHDNKTNKYAIVVHGYTNKKEDFYDIVRHYYEKGFNVLSPDLRAHGESEGNYIGMGWLDKDDIEVWINYINGRDNNSTIILHGVSMGAATCMMVSGDRLPSSVKLVIEDCGYTSAKDIFASELKVRYRFPEFPLIQALALVTKFHAKYDILNDASSLKQVSKSKIPILVIHGDKDNFVPVDMAYEIYDKIKGNKEISIFNGAGHAECRFLDPDAYYSTVFNFIDERL